MTDRRFGDPVHDMSSLKRGAVETYATERRANQVLAQSQMRCSEPKRSYSSPGYDPKFWTEVCGKRAVVSDHELGTLCAKCLTPHLIKRVAALPDKQRLKLWETLTTQP